MKMIRHFADEHEHEHDKLLVLLLLMSTAPCSPGRVRSFLREGPGICFLATGFEVQDFVSPRALGGRSVGEGVG